MTTFRYRHEPSAAFGSVLRPVASVTLSTPSARLEVAMYIDSGADITLIPFRLGRSLGFRQRPVEDIRELSGIGGAGVPYTLRRVTMHLGDAAFSVQVAWALIEEVPLLLGRADVFSRFQILFDERARRITFTPVSARSQRTRNR